MLRNAVLTALTIPDATLFTVYDLLTDAKFRKAVMKNIEQEWLRNFWKNEIGKAGGFQQVKMMGGVTAKIGRYHASVSAERILSQPKSTINFSDILDGKILICNLAKGKIGEDTSEVLGIAVLAQLQLAAYRRVNKAVKDRKPFYIHVDEFQNFATTSFVEMLSESRKYKLCLTMAEQTVSQQSDQKTVNTILANAGTIVCFKTNNPADEKQFLPIFTPFVEQGEIPNLSAYSFYAKLSGGQKAQEPTSGVTLLSDAVMTDPQITIESSKQRYVKHFLEDGPAKNVPKSNKPQPKRLMTKNREHSNLQ